MKSIKALLDKIEKYLDQKVILFQQLQTLTEEQSQMLAVEEINLETFEVLLEAKDNPIKKIDHIDEALSTIIDQHQHLLTSGLEAHNEQIDRIKLRLEQINAIGLELSRIEETNKNKLNQHFNLKRQDSLSFKKSKQAASKYNQNMGNTHQNDMSYFMDRKK